MKRLEWNSSYLVGVPEIDKQHQRLFGLVQGLHAAGARMGERKVLIAALNEMVSYLGEHFKSEEDLMSRHPEIDRHALEHWDFVQKTLEFKKQFEEGDLDYGTLYDFLSIWLKEHTLKMDQEYFRYLQDKG